MNVWIIIVGMMLVTFIPRAIPAFFVEKMRFGRRFEKFIGLIPYTAMTALIFPGVLNMDSAHWYVGVIGAVAAILLALSKKIPTAFVVFGSVASVALAYLVIL